MVEEIQRQPLKFYEIDSGDNLPSELLGWRDKDCYYIRPTTLTDTLLKDFSAKVVIASLRQQGMLQCEGSALTIRKRVVKGEPAVRVYAISRRLFGDGDDAEPDASDGDQMTKW